MNICPPRSADSCSFQKGKTDVEDYSALLDCNKGLPAAAVEQSVPAMAVLDLPWEGSGSHDRRQIFSTFLEVSRPVAAFFRFVRRTPPRAATSRLGDSHLLPRLVIPKLRFLQLRDLLLSSARQKNRR